MADKIAWYGTEVEGKYAGIMTLFLRGGAEDRFGEVIEAMNKSGVTWRQLYLAAGSTPAPEAAVLELLKKHKAALGEKIITIEVPFELLPGYKELMKEDVHFMVTTVTPADLPIECTLKLRNDTHLFVSTKVSHLEINEVFGSYASDVVLL